MLISKEFFNECKWVKVIKFLNSRILQKYDIFRFTAEHLKRLEFIKFNEQKPSYSGSSLEFIWLNYIEKSSIIERGKNSYYGMKLNPCDMPEKNKKISIYKPDQFILLSTVIYFDILF